MGFMDDLKDGLTAATQANQGAGGAEVSEEDIAALKAIKVTTGDVAYDYEIECVVFNIGSSTGMLGFIGPSPDQAFKQAEASLKMQAKALNCDAVVHTMFEHRITVNKGALSQLTGPNQGIEVFAYGTAVRRK